MTLWVSPTPEKLGDSDDDMTIATLPERPCALCGQHPWHLPHSICDECIEAKRQARVHQR